MILRTERRKGATVIECAFAYPIFFLLLIGLIVAGLGVFRYQEVSSLAREGARYASVRGSTYERRTGLKSATEKEIYEKIIQPNAHGMDKSKLTYAVSWSPDKERGSQVTVQVKYRWIPEAFFGGMDLSSTSTVSISY